MHLAEHYYHVYNRGCNRERIFANAENYVFLLRRVKNFLPDYSLSIIAYCLIIHTPYVTKHNNQL
jgi:putative transposase